MRYQHVRIRALGHALPEERVPSLALEDRLAPVYERLRLRPGRLELMSGIAERRFWPPGTRPSEVAARAGRAALEAGGIEPAEIGCLVHASVCRDFLEPATASVVHRRLGLPDACTVYDLSNACLGVANGMIEVANRIELGQVRAGLVVAGEDGRALVEETVRACLDDPALSREDFKRAFASLTIGSGAAAVLLERAEEGADRRLVGGVVRSATGHAELCQGDRETGAAGPLMSTDAEALLLAGNRLAARTFEDLLAELAWTRADIDRVVTHQVGSAHRRTLFETLELDPGLDHPTYERFGNVGSVSLPLSLSLAVDEGVVRAGDRLALLGIGSGLNCLMLGVEW